MMPPGPPLPRGCPTSLRQLFTPCKVPGIVCHYDLCSSGYSASVTATCRPDGSGFNLELDGC
jgi:hypothetical protein